MWRNFRNEDISDLRKSEWDEICSIQGDAGENVNVDLRKSEWDETCSIQGDAGGNVNVLGGQIIG